MYSFPSLEPVHCSMSSSNCCFLTCMQVLQEADKVGWYSNLLKNFPLFVVIHTVKVFGVVNKAEVDVSLELSRILIIQQMLAIWSLVPLPFLNPACTSGSFRFTYCWSLAWRILSITLLALEWLQLCGSLNSSVTTGLKKVVSLSKLWEMVKDRDIDVLQSMRSQRVGHVWAPEQHWYQETWEIEKQEGDLEGYLKQCELPPAGSSCCQFIIQQGVIRWVTTAY